MIHQDTIWSVFQRYAPKQRWISLSDIYRSIETHGELDDEDWEPQSPSSEQPKLKRNVRNVLQYYKQTT